MPDLRVRDAGTQLDELNMHDGLIGPSVAGARWQQCIVKGKVTVVVLTGSTGRALFMVA